MYLSGPENDSTKRDAIRRRLKPLPVRRAIKLRPASRYFDINENRLGDLGVVPTNVYSGIASVAGGAIKNRKAAGAVGGAVAGAQVGSTIFPGIGTAIGAVVGAIVGALSGKTPPTRQKQTFGAFKKTTGPLLGREVPINTILDGLYYPFKMTDHGIFRVRKQFGTLNGFVTEFAKQITNAAMAGQITDADDASSVYSKVISPWFWPIAGKVTKDVTDTVPKLLTALADHYLYDQPMVGTISKYGNANIPKLSDALNAARGTAGTTANISMPATNAALPPIAAPTSQEFLPVSPSVPTIQSFTSDTDSGTPSEQVENKVSAAGMFSGASGLLVPTLIGAAVLFLSRKKKRHH